MIKSYKKYENLITFGCSFTGGHLLGEEGSWGFALSKLLGCNHINKAGGGSNTNMLNNIINYCENNDMSNSCIGIQWSEVTRREYWDNENNCYNTLGLGTFDPQHRIFERETSHYDTLSFIKDNYPFFGPMWFTLTENLLRTIVAMISAKSYLKSKNIDFIMFEGINSIKTINKSFYPENYPTDINNIDFSRRNDFKLLSDDIRMSILNDDTFFSELGDWMSAMYNHPKFDTKINDGHPHQEIVDWWVENLYRHIKNVENKK
jgi:hypothetical protein